jgi:tetratricopeptide (TPR) repeat protein
LAEHRTLRHWLGRTVVGLTAVFVFPVLAAQAAPNPTTTISGPPSRQNYFDLGKYYEVNGQWSLALEQYEYLLTLDRTDAEAKRRFLAALRQVHRKYRHNDPSFMGQVVNPEYTLTKSLEFYRDVLRKVQEFYHNSERVQATYLFQQGLEELLTDLDDKDFCAKHLKQGVTADEIQKFKGHLRDKYGKVKVKDLAEAAEQLFSVARDALRKVELRGTVVVVEFACGACNALDEYSFYLPQAGMGNAPMMKATLDWEIVEEGILHIRLTGFDDQTLDALDRVLAQLENNKIKSLILDLRGNPGGSLDVSVQVVERFVPAPQPIAGTKGKLVRNFQSFGMAVVELPLFVLVDSTTASAAELVAGALKAHKRAELIGQTTYGKNSIQKMVPVSQVPYGGLKLSWAEFHLAKLDDMAKHGGIVPTIQTGSDPNEQRAVALERARMPLSMR